MSNKTTLNQYANVNMYAVCKMPISDNPTVMYVLSNPHFAKEYAHNKLSTPFYIVNTKTLDVVYQSN